MKRLIINNRLLICLCGLFVFFSGCTFFNENKKSVDVASGLQKKANDFWAMLDNLIKKSEIVIDWQKNTAHPRYPDFIYPVDYGFLKGTSASDGNEVDIWVGTETSKKLMGFCVQLIQ